MRISRSRRPKSLTALAVAALRAATEFIFNPFSASARVDTSAWYVIESRSSSLVLDIEGASGESGAELVQWNRTDSQNQQFRFVDSGGGYFRIEARHSGKVIDVRERSTIAGDRISQYSPDGGATEFAQLVRGELRSPGMLPADVFR